MGSPKGGRRSRQQRRRNLGRISRAGTTSAACVSGIGRSPSKASRQSSAKVRPKEVHYAASVGHVNWLQMCLQKAENPTQADINGFSALHTAALRGRLDCIEVMVERYGVDVNLPSLTGWCPVHLVLSKENGDRALECLKFLISKGANVNVRNHNGMSPLHRAASEGHDKCVRALIRAGADVNAKDGEGQKPIDLARMWGQRACAKSLMDAMWKVEKAHVAKEKCKLKGIKAEIEARRRQFLQKEQTEVDACNAAAFEGWLSKKRLSPPSHRILSYLEKRRPSRGAVSPTVSFVPPPAPQEKVHVKERGLRPWNPSTSLSSRPATHIYRPTAVRLGVEPEEAASPDFSSFLFLARNALGGPEIRVAPAGRVPLVPDLPLEELRRGLFPQRWPPRLRLPWDLRPMDIQALKHRREPDPQHRWTDQLALSLRQTLDPACARTLRAHLCFLTGAPSPGPRRDSGQGVTSSSSSSSSSSHSTSLLSKGSSTRQE
ncbi:ankyrin repeat domain-containing protein 53 [Anolis sagrei]|uniref:ankyrin repeat domain-containing protein 53 n=1 Tax=Anolis sagrei TaxID=38937 RepID=UPI003521094F